jgi:Tfp pilus assembly protein PilN
VIEVNLLPGGKKRAVRGKRKAFALPKLGGSVHDRWILGAVLFSVVGVATIGWLFYSVGSAHEELGVELEAALADSARYSEQMGRTTALLATRDSIVQRVSVIQEIDQGRYVWPHVMDEISRALPDYIWLQQLQQIAGGPAPHIRLVGQAGSIEALTVFMDQLESSPFLSAVRTIGTTQVLSDNQLIYRYELEMDYEQPPIEFLETVPLLETQAEERLATAASPGN